MESNDSRKSIKTETKSSWHSAEPAKPYEVGTSQKSTKTEAESSSLPGEAVQSDEVESSQQSTKTEAETKKPVRIHIDAWKHEDNEKSKESSPPSSSKNPTDQQKSEVSNTETKNKTSQITNKDVETQPSQNVEILTSQDVETQPSQDVEILTSQDVGTQTSRDVGTQTSQDVGTQTSQDVETQINQESSTDVRSSFDDLIMSDDFFDARSENSDSQRIERLESPSTPPKIDPSSSGPPECFPSPASWSLLENPENIKHPYPDVNPNVDKDWYITDINPHQLKQVTEIPIPKRKEGFIPEILPPEHLYSGVMVKVEEPDKRLPQIGVPPGVIIPAPVKVSELTLAGVAVACGFYVGSQVIQAVRFQPRKFTNTEVPEDLLRERRKQPSIFISTYLSGESATLGHWMVATKDLPGLDQKLKKCMVGQIVAITDTFRRGVIIEIFLRQSSFVDTKKIHIKSFTKLSIMEELILMINFGLDWLS